MGYTAITDFYWLRFPFIVMVVFIHSPGVGKIPDFVDISDISSLSSVDYWNLFRIAFSNVLPRVAVPGFFLISGYLFFYKCSVWNKTTYFYKLKKRFYTLFIPYVLWNVIHLLVPILMFYILGFSNHKYTISAQKYIESVDWIRWIWDFSFINESEENWLGIWHEYTYPINIPLWYVRDLMVVCLLTPVIYWSIKKLKFPFLCILALAHILEIWPNVHGLSSIGLLYFSLGAYFSINKINIIKLFRKVEVPCCVIALIVAIVLIPYNNETKIGVVKLSEIFILAGIVPSFTISSRLVSNRFGTINNYFCNRCFSFMLSTRCTSCFFALNSYSLFLWIGALSIVSLNIY